VWACIQVGICRKVSPLYDDLHDRDEGGDLYPWYWEPSLLFK
jgi:hypothetical protein